MFNLNIYKCDDDRRVIDKNIGEGISLEGDMRDQCDINEPIIMVEWTDDIKNYNYMYVPEFKKYYFLNEPIAYRTGLWILSGKVDVLNTYKYDILNSECLVDRNAERLNPYISDDEEIVQVNSEINTVKFSTDDQLGNYSGNMHYVLTVAGKGAL